jgi:uncharacterized protein YcfJ
MADWKPNCTVLVRTEVSTVTNKIQKSILASAFLATVLTPLEITASAAPANDPVQYQYAVADASATPQYEQVVVRRRYRRSRYVVRRRSRRRSAEIVGGSALGGAAIGALAGGGKGAGIGALAGGTAGYIYDRKTHKKVVRQY